MNVSNAAAGVLACTALVSAYAVLATVQPATAEPTILRIGTGDEPEAPPSSVVASEPESVTAVSDEASAVIRPRPHLQLPAATYSSERFATPFTYTVPEGWKMFEDEPGQFGLALVDDDGPCLCVWRDVRAAARDCAEEPEPGVGATAEDIASWLADHEGLNHSQPTPVTVGGLDGVMIDVAMASSWTGACPFSGGNPIVMTLVGTAISSGVHWGTDANDSQRVYLLDVADGGNIAIVIEVGFGRAFNDLDSNEFRDRIATVTPVVDSFEFATPTTVDNGTTLPRPGPGARVLFRAHAG